MKKIFLLMVITLAILTLLSGCSFLDNRDGNTVKGDKLNVVTSFYPMYDFTQKVGGDKISIENMVPVGIEPHDWEPSPDDIISLEKADVFIYNGAGMEHWIDKVLATLGNQDLIIVEASKNINLIPGHNHLHDEANHDETNHAEEVSSETMDSHVWLSIKNAKKEMSNIKVALQEADPVNSDYYEENYLSYSEAFDALDQKFNDTLKGLANKDIIVAHQAFGYLCADYGLNQIAIEGLSSETEPNPVRMREIIEFAKENQIKTIFFEELVSPRVAEAIASEVGVQTESLNTLEGLSQEQLANGEEYLSIMNKNLEKLAKALQ